MADAADFSKFDRYEFVAVALPGAALLLGLLYLFHEQVSAKLHSLGVKEPFGASFQALGIFVVASFIAGHVLQAVAHYAEKLAERARPEPVDPLQDLKPPRLRASVVTALCTIDPNLKPDHIKAAADGFTPCGMQMVRQMRAELLVRVRNSGHTDFLDTLKVNSGVNRGLCGVSVIVGGAAAIACHPVVFVTASLASALFWKRYRDYEHDRDREIWIQIVAIHAAERRLR